MSRCSVIAVVCLYLLPAFAFAQFGASKEDVDKLKAQVELLQAKIDFLEERMKRVLLELDNIRDDIRTGNTAVTRNDPKNPKNGKIKPPSKKKSNGPEKFQRPKPRIYGSATQIIQDIPADMRPKSGIWSSEAVKRAKNWLGQVPVGQKFEAELTLSRKPNIRKNPKYYLKTEKQQEKQWEVKLYFKPVTTIQWGVKFNQKVYDAWPDQIKIYGNDNFKKLALNLKANDRIRISGTIAAVRLGPQIGNARDCTLDLKDYKVQSKVLDE